jgi:hypothetical protein
MTTSDTSEQIRNHFVNVALSLIDPNKRKALTFSKFRIFVNAFKDVFNTNQLPFKNRTFPVFLGLNNFCLDIKIDNQHVVYIKEKYNLERVRSNIAPSIKEKITPLLISFFNLMNEQGLDLKNETAFNKFVGENLTINDKLNIPIKHNIVNSQQDIQKPIINNKVDETKLSVSNLKGKEEQKSLSKKEKKEMLLKLEKTLHKLQKQQEKVELLYAKAKKIKDKL